MTYDQQAIGDLQTASGIRTVDAEDLFELQESELSGLNKKQICLAQLPISKVDRDPAMFTTYDVKLGVRLYSGRTDTTPINLSETTTTITLDPPAAPESEWDPEDGIPEDLELNFIPAGTVSETVDLSTLDPNLSGEVNANLDVAFIVNKEISIPNMLTMFFHTEMPAGVANEGDIVVQYAQYAPADGSLGTFKESVVCKTVLGDVSATEIYSYAGTSSLASADVAG